MKTAIVIGAGFGGISAALRLKAKGYQVSIVDRCSMIGGRAQVYKKGGFTHDAGPTVITAPFLFEELFNLFNKNLHDYLNLVELNPWYQFVFSDGETFNYGASLDETLAEIKRINPNDCENYRRLLEDSRQIFEIGFEDLADKPFHNFTSMLKMVPQLIKLKSHQSVWQFVSNHLESNHLKQAFSIQPLLVGGNPFDTTSIYSLIHFLENKWGIHFVMGGTGTLVNALRKLMIEEGIDIQLNKDVKNILIEGKDVKGVELTSGETMYSDIVVANTDPAFMYKNLIHKKSLALSAKLKAKYSQFSMGLYVLYFGTNRKYHDVKHHTIILGTEYESLLDDIFNKKVLNDNFSMYLHRPTATDESFAPTDCDSFYVLVPVPNLQAKINWDIEGAKLKDKIIAALSNTVLPDLEKCIVHDFYKTPMDFSCEYSSMHGAGFSVAPKFTQSAWFRFHNQAEGLNNLYLVGAGTHPGAGLPGVVSSAKVIERLVP